MAFDFKKEYREFYMPPKKPGLVKVPAMNYIAGRGHALSAHRPRRVLRAVRLGVFLHGSGERGG